MGRFWQILRQSPNHPDTTLCYTVKSKEPYKAIQGVIDQLRIVDVGHLKTMQVKV